MSRAFPLSLFDPPSKSFLVPTKVKTAVARRHGQGRPFGRRAWRASLDGDEHGRTLGDLGALRERRRHGPPGLPCLWFAIVLGALTPQPSHAAERSAASATIATSIDEAAARFELPRGWISAVIAVESGGDVRARSPKGAMGLMQLMPGTWRALSVQHQLGSDPYDQRANVLAGSAYLRELFDQFGPEGFLAAYNAGPSRYLEARMDRRPLPPETVAYVAKVERKIAGAPDVWPPVRVKRLSDWRTSNLFVGAPSFSEKGEAGGLFPEPANGVSP